jgi:hypothetical protein
MFSIFLQAGTHSPIHHNYYRNLSVDRQTYYSYISLFNMVQIKPLIAFLLAAATIADVVAQPVAFRGMGAVRGAVR